MRGDRDRGDPGRQDRVEDGQVVRGEVPQHVDVRLDQAEVDADRVEVLDVAQLTRVHQLAQPLHDGRVAEGVVQHQHQAAFLGGGHELDPVRVRRRQGLLHQHVLAGLQGGHRDFEVGRGRRGHGDRVDLRVGEYLGER
ncbi:hypothetical protein GCM10029964_094040 [Kibdelosporangium lantanae]